MKNTKKDVSQSAELDELRRKVKELESSQAKHYSLEAINKIAHVLHRSLDFQTVVEQAVDSMMCYCQSPSVGIFEFNEKELCLDLIHAKGFSEKTLRIVKRLPLSGSLTGEAATHKKIVVSEDMSKDNRYHPEAKESLLEEGHNSVISIPLFFQERLVGVMNLIFYRKYVPTDYEKETFLSIGKTIALAMVNAKHVERIEAEVKQRQQTEAALRNSEERYRALYENNPSMYFTLDAEEIILSVNLYGANQLGYCVSELVGKPFTLISDKEDEEPIYQHPSVHLQFSSKPEHGEVRAIRKDGSEFWIRKSMRSVIGMDGNPIKLVVCEDISDLKRVEESQKNLNEEIQATYRELEDFSFSVSHDLRTPLRAIDGFSAILIEKYMESIPLEAQRYAKVIRSSAQKMGHLLDGMRDFLSINRKPITKVPIEPDVIVKDVLSELKHMQEGRQAEISIGKLAPCKADSRMMKIVYHNILSNALKFSRKCDVARIEIGCRKEKKDNIYFIKDNGVGFDMRYADKVFSVYQRLHSQDEFEGIGIGMAMVNNILRHHGGRIWVDSEPGKGTTFSFTV